MSETITVQGRTYHVGDGHHVPCQWRDDLTKRKLFQSLCEVSDLLQEEGIRLDFSPHKLQLEAITERLDTVIDQVQEEGVVEEREEDDDGST